MCLTLHADHLCHNAGKSAVLVPFSHNVVLENWLTHVSKRVDQLDFGHLSIK